LADRFSSLHAPAAGIILKMYKAILFDFFGVFCAPIATNWFKKAVPDYNEEQLKTWQALCTQSDLGKLSRANFNVEASRLTGVPVPEIIRGIEAEAFINIPLVIYTRELKSREYRIACLSNGSHEWTLQVINDHDLGELFNEIVLSGDLGIVKPDPEIYEYTLKKLGISAAEAIFVDDRKVNVEAGKACGIRSLVFTDTPTFIADLETVFKESANDKATI
jgi:FMN phosphatase YigB (HAD superfamily)